MNAVDARLRNARDAARRRAWVDAALVAAPWLLVAATLAWRTHAAPWSLAVVVATLLAGALHAWQRGRGFDDRWLARQLDARRRDMDDSADLLFPHATPDTALQHLQRERLRQRVQNGSAIDLRAPWHIRGLLVGAALAAACIVAIVLYPATQPATRTTPATPEAAATQARPARLVGQRIEIRQPAYTNLPTRSIDTLEAKIPEGSTLHWQLDFTPTPRRVELVFHDGERLALRREGGSWIGSRRIAKPSLYRLQLEHPLPPEQAGPHRLEVVVDQPPQLRALQPRQTLSLLEPGQRSWTLEFEATDDYGLAPNARLQITRTIGGGENITTRKQVVTLRGRGDPTGKRYRHRIDLAALGLVAGDDVIARLSISDRRAPDPQTTQSPSYILRWPPEPIPTATDLDGLVKRVMPAYFRSQRQIIIDAEALLKEKPALAADRYLARSDAIGVDQRLLRLRYGQFLGEETGGTPKVLPTNDAQDLQQVILGEEPAVAAAEPHDDEHGDEHAGDLQRQPTFGEEQAVLEQFGHTHDHAEAATLLDPGTRKLLRAALDEMWQSELNLRQGHPELALPYAHRALAFIKQVQQAERIYLPRIGSQLPPIDPSRRLGGEREGLGDRRDPLAEATTADPVVAEAWRALAPVTTGEAATAPDLDALADWVASHETGDADPLELAVAIDALRRDANCLDCRQRLRQLLWPLLAPPPAGTGERPSAGPVGNAYLDALGREARP
ncbi:hypothetical protein [Novilysobacter erysipheiresistens]|uniref:DUF4175 domain-containing protein n=1 Tax=Novilysobacter erysipheiresistens TaxID=1749332 RepID=A0ABU7YWD4_9GAMM